MNKDQAMAHMAKGGWVYRNVPQYGSRFFYKIENGRLLCRCNELGGWNPAVCDLKPTDELHVAEIDAN